MSSDKIEQFELPQLSALELNRIVVMDEAARLSSLSKDAIEENYSDLIRSCRRNVRECEFGTP